MAHNHSCTFLSVLRHLTSSPSGCLERVDLGSNNTTNKTRFRPDRGDYPPWAHELRFPVYVLNVPHLTRRRAFMTRQLASLNARDVTWILCANKLEVDAMGPKMRACAYPCVQLNRYFAMNKTTNEPEAHGNSYIDFLSNGTVSLALKHKIAAFDIMRRKLDCALILEDDAVLPPTLFASLDYVAKLPERLKDRGGIDLFWMGSYSSRKNVGTLIDHEPISMPYDAKTRQAKTDPVLDIKLRKRNATRFPPIFGAVGYVLFSPAADLVASEPVTTAADIAISYFPKSHINHEMGGRVAGHPQRVYLDGTCESDPWQEGTLPKGVARAKYVQRTPTEQYGPHEWILWPVPPQDQQSLFGDRGGTHMHNGGRMLAARE